VIHGRARVFGDHINTDYIISSRRKRETLDPLRLREFVFEDVDPHFAATVEPGDVIVAGRNFGCGSAMEVAVTALQGAGIQAVLAQSFSRTYFRNAVNNGMIPVTCDTGVIREGDRVSLELVGGPAECAVEVRNLSTGDCVRAEPLARLLVAIIRAGGLAPFFKQYGGFPSEI
jgi:3-isopropylmalate/(R)-2-methylmalate dehydratase small subunit